MEKIIKKKGEFVAIVGPMGDLLPRLKISENDKCPTQEKSPKPAFPFEMTRYMRVSPEKKSKRKQKKNPGGLILEGEKLTFPVLSSRSP